jgi:hypothetical protein
VPHVDGRQDLGHAWHRRRVEPVEVLAQVRVDGRPAIISDGFFDQES